MLNAIGLLSLFTDIFRDFLEESFDVKSHANQAIQGRAITEQLSKLAEGISLLDREIHSQVPLTTLIFEHQTRLLAVITLKFKH